jgi:hypothetical protein
MPFVIEVVMDLRVNRAEFLKRPHASKSLHRPLASSKRLM